MSQSSKVLLFAVLLTAGICAASLFRKPPGAVAESATAAPAPFTHRLEGPRVVAGPAIADVRSPQPVDATSIRPAAPRASLGSDATASGPPDFPASSPIGSFPLGAPPSWPAEAQAIGHTLRDPGGRRLHRVEDGDTLASLAELYYGDGARADGIREANGDKLPSSGALPIGVDLVIPPATAIPRATAARPASTGSDVDGGIARSADTAAPQAPSSPAAFAEPKSWPGDSTVPRDNPVAPGVIRPASEPLR